MRACQAVPPRSGIAKTFSGVRGSCYIPLPVVPSCATPDCRRLTGHGPLVHTALQEQMDIPGASGAESLALQIIIEADDCFIAPCISLRSFVKRHNKVRQLGAITLDLCSTAVQANCRKGLFFVYAAHFLRPLCGGLALYHRSPRTEHLLIYRIQSHTYPKRRKFCLKHAGQKSVKDKLPEQRKGPKRAVECRLKVQTHVWEQDAGSPSLPTRTKNRLKTDVMRRFS